MKRTYSFVERVHFPDIDFGGGLYHARYLDYMDKARSAMYREHCIDIGRLFRERFALVVVDAKLKYLRPVRLDDLICVYTRLVNYTDKSLTVEQLITNRELSFDVVEADVIEGPSVVHKATITLVGANLIIGKAVLLPSDFTCLLQTCWRIVA